MEKITIYFDLQDLPADVHGAVTKDDAGAYYILLNGTDDHTRQEQAFLHEMAHIWRHDLDKNGSVDGIERELHSNNI